MVNRGEEGALSSKVPRLHGNLRLPLERSAIHHSPFTIHDSPFTIHHSPFTAPGFLLAFGWFSLYHVALRVFVHSSAQNRAFI